MPGSTHTVTGLSTGSSPTNTQLLLLSFQMLPDLLPKAIVSGEPKGLILIRWWIPVIMSPIYSPFQEISQLWFLDTIYQRAHYIPILFLFPSLNIHFVGRQDCMEDGYLVCPVHQILYSKHWTVAHDFPQNCRGTSTAPLFSFRAVYSECHPPQKDTNIHTAVPAQAQHFHSSPYPNCWT